MDNDSTACASLSARSCASLTAVILACSNVIQAWLQDFAWSEAEVPAKKAELVARGESLHEIEQLEAEPIFCMETALKLHHWSQLAYRDLGKVSTKVGDEETGDDHQSQSNAEPQLMKTVGQTQGEECTLLF